MVLLRIIRQLTLYEFHIVNNTKGPPQPVYKRMEWLQFLATLLLFALGTTNQSKLVQ